MPNSDSSAIAPPAPASQAQKLARRLHPSEWKKLPGWAFEWLYWNAGLHSFTQFEPLYDSYLLSRPRSKYGVTAPIVIYQMGKVASTAMQHSLQALHLNVPIYQLHFMAPRPEVVQWASNKRAPGSGRQLLLRRAEYVADAIRTKKWKQVSMISLVRAPAPQLLSTFFQGLPLNMRGYEAQLERGEISAQQVADYFVGHFHPFFQEQWFEHQLQEPFGIDVYATPFDKARGYQYYARDNIRLVVMRYEDIDRVLAPVMREFLGIPDFRLVSANVGEDKKYGELYRNVQKILRLTPERIAEMNSTPYAQHFYTPQELAKSVERWTAT